MRKRTLQEVEKIVKDKGYSLLEVYWERNLAKVVIEDIDGYKYEIQLNNLINNHKPDFVGTYNKFSLANISLWLNKNNKPFSLCENNTYTGNNKKLFFKCLKESCQESFDSLWNSISNGRGCPYCIGKRVGKKNNLSYIRPDLVNEWDYSKNKKCPEEYSWASNEKVFWKCQTCGSSWFAEIFNRSKDNGTGCPRCNQSKGEKRIFSWIKFRNKELINNGISKIIPQKTFSNCKNKKELQFDFSL